ncbi:hypothetical protein [Streptomyces sp. NPDC020917]|uniref:hypothetical protein n=1 Tax=Streptomyces sp. NPDC020917 TaxID=3365102 RepID=UPI0037AE6579
MTTQAAEHPSRDGLPSVFRFATELVAWIATPWWLAHTSWVLAVLSLVVLVGLPTVFATPGDKAQVIVAVPGWGTVLLVLMEIAAAVVSAWALWPVWAAVCVTVLAAVTLVTEGPRRRRLLRAR